ncbi:hypothetical protein HETIRDRAFT_232886, partial [Heterobasidion irregulare TC 32-1]
YLYMPVFVNGNHWVSMQVDFQMHSVAYGDLLSNPHSLKKAVQHLQGWLKHVFKVSFHDAEDSLVHGLQNNTYFCGICTINTIEHNTFGAELFMHASRRLWHVRYFNQLAKLHNESSNVKPTMGYFPCSFEEWLDNDQATSAMDS